MQRIHYGQGPCRHCSETVSTNGRAKAAHNRKHVREGVLVEVRSQPWDGPEGPSHFVTPAEAERRITQETLCNWVVVSSSLAGASA